MALISVMRMVLLKSLGLVTQLSCCLIESAFKGVGEVLGMDFFVPYMFKWVHVGEVWKFDFVGKRKAPTNNVLGRGFWCLELVAHCLSEVEGEPEDGEESYDCY